MPLQLQFYIGGSCVISNGSIVKNGAEIYSDALNSDVAEFLHVAYKSMQTSYPKFYKMDNLAKLGWLASETLLQANTGIPGEADGNIAEADKDSVCVLLCNASSSLDTDLRYYDTVAGMPSPALFVYTLPNIVTGEICIRNGFKGENAFFIRDAFDAEFLYRQVSLMLSDDSNKICLCGWVELLGNNYKAAMMLVEKTGNPRQTIFTPGNIHEIFNAVPERNAIATT